MKNSEVSIGILVGLGLAILIVLLFIAFKGTTAGNVVLSPTINFPSQNQPSQQQPQPNSKYQDNYDPVYNPGKYATGSAVLNPPFYANAWNVKTDSVNLELKNNGGEDYLIKSVEISGCGAVGGTTVLKVNQNQNFQILCNQYFQIGEQFKGDITITYRKLSSSFDLTSTGTMAERVTQ